MKFNGMNIHSSDVISDQERIYATWIHFSGLFIPVGNFLIPMILWLLKRGESHYIDQQGREVMNFQLTIIFYAIFALILIATPVGWIFVPVILLLHLTGTLAGTLKTWQGRVFRYPVTFRVIRSA